jgi:geranylgeranyl diphosphate synthase type I
LVNESRLFPTLVQVLEQVLDVLRRKSGNYTVQRPLEIGAAMAGCGPRVVDALAEYGGAVGEAFQLRDDVLGVVGSPTATGKPVGTDLSDQKATSVVVAAYELAIPAVRRELVDYMSSRELGADDVERWRRLIVAGGAVQPIEQLIDDRLQAALEHLDDVTLCGMPRAALEAMAVVCTDRAA